jgi:zinc transport system permease protein
MDILYLLQHDFLPRAFVGGACAALLCSILGVFIVLRRSSLIGEGIAHLSFGGIAVGLFFSIYPLYTALVLSLFGTLLIALLSRRQIVYSETAIGIIFSFGLALGAVLASLAGGFTVDLFAFLFGYILTITFEDLLVILVLTAIVFVFVVVFFKEMMHITFDEKGARVAGVPINWFDLAFNVLVALTVVVSIKVVGSLLISALLIIPAASAMQFSRSFRGTMLAAVLLGLVAVVSGMLLSFYYDVATGGAIVLISIGIFVVCVAYKKVGRKAPGQVEPEAPCGPIEIDEPEATSIRT